MGKKTGELKTPTFGFVSFGPQGEIYLSELNQPTLLIYAPPYTHSPTTIGLPGNGGVVAVDWKTGVFGVTSSPSSPNGINKIMFFRHGEVKPCKVLYPKLGDLDGADVFDGEGTLFDFIVGNSGDDTLISVAGECSAKTYQTYRPVLNMSELHFNIEDQLLIGTLTQGYTAGPTITYPHPYGRVLGRPVAKTYLKAINGKGMYALSISSDGKTLWASNLADAIAQYNYPSGGAPLKSMDLAGAWWVAAYPQLVP